MSALQVAVAVTVIIIISFVLYFKRTYGYWRGKKVEYLEPKIPWGNLENPLFTKKGFIGVLRDAYRTFKSKGKQYGGIYLLNKPVLVPTDPSLVKCILSKDFSYFMNHGSFYDVELEPLTGNLFNVEDEYWRNLRVQLTPVFTSGKMKMMFNAILSCCEQMIEHIEHLCTEQKPLYVKDIVSRYTIDVIGSCAFGLDCNSFKNPDAEFRKYGRRITEATPSTAIRAFILFMMPELHRILKLKIIDKEVSDFFTNTFKDVLKNRVSTNTQRKDFIQLLLQMSGSHSKTSKSLSTEEMVAQAFVFFAAGFETSSSNLGFSLYKLALHQDIQNRVRKEIQDVLSRYNGQLTYEALNEMKYMDQVIDETLRLYPPLPTLTRKCSKDYVIPGTNDKIDKGSSVMISVVGLHMDEEYYPNPEKFDPDRFTKENKSKRPQFVYIPFGDGPRICIGQRFAMLQIKIGMSLILRSFRILPHEKTPKSLTYVIDSPLISCPENLLLSCEPI